MTDRRNAKLALVQFDNEGSVDGAFEKASSTIRTAAMNGADLVVFPELFATGLDAESGGSTAVESAVSLKDPRFDSVCRTARDASCWVVLPVALVYEDGRLPRNSAVIIDRASEIVGTYDKIHLWSLERYCFQRGSRLPVFDTDFGKVGIILCCDALFPETVRQLARRGADLVVCPGGWRADDASLVDVSLPARAYENALFVASVSPASVEGCDCMRAATRVYDPRGKCIARREEEFEGVLYASVDFADAQEYRALRPFLQEGRSLFESADLSLRAGDAPFSSSVEQPSCKGFGTDGEGEDSSPGRSAYLGFLRNRCAAIALEYGLSEREGEVLSLWVEGRPASAIASLLYIAESTVRSHVKSIYAKTDARGRASLISLVFNDRSK